MIRALRQITALLLTLALTLALLPGGFRAQAAAGGLLKGHEKGKKPLRLLAVGNSFSVDGLEYLCQIADSAGYRVTIGNLYIASCSLANHLHNTRYDEKEYVYYKYYMDKNGSFKRTVKGVESDPGSLQPISEALLDEEWDVITLQQASATAGDPDSYRSFDWRCEREKQGAAQLSGRSGEARLTSLSLVEQGEETSSAPPTEPEPDGRTEEDALPPQEPESVPPEEPQQPEEEAAEPAASETAKPAAPETGETTLLPEEPEAPETVEEPVQPQTFEAEPQQADPVPEDEPEVASTQAPEVQEEYAAPTYNGDGKQDQTIAIASCGTGQGCTFELKASAKTKLTYESEDESVAKVDGKGNVTLCGSGETQVTVTAVATKNYHAAEAEVTISCRETTYLAQLQEALLDVYTYGTENRVGWGEEAAERVRFGWQSIWSYAKKNVNPKFAERYQYYKSDQNTMYRAIQNTTRNVVLPSNRFDFFVPTGTAVQNVRSSYVGDRLNRDGVHLTLGLGRYIAGMTWAGVLGVDLSKAAYLPTGQNAVKKRELAMVRECVANALNTPWSVTKSKYGTAPKLKAPALKSPANTTGGLKLTWDKVSGTGGYRIYRRKGSGSYQCIKAIAKAATTSYTDTAVKKKTGVTYTYYVTSWYQTNYGAAEHVKGVKKRTPVAMVRIESDAKKRSQTRLTAPTGLKMKNTAKGIQVSWKKVKNATSYQLYRAVNGKKRTSLATVKGGKTTTFTDSTAKSKNGTTYTYSVAACTKWGEGVSCGGKKLLRLTEVRMKKVKQTKNNALKLSWSRNKKAVGYTIYRRVDKGKWSKVKTIGQNKTVSYEDRTVKPGRTYSYRMFAYKGSVSSPVSNTLQQTVQTPHKTTIIKQITKKK